MACGCQNTCGCIILGDGETTTVAQQGDTFTVSAIPFIRSVQDTDCIDLEVDIDGVLTATPVINDDPATVSLACSEDGLEASLLIDPDSTAIVTQSVDGLRVDVPAPPPTPDSAQPGDYLFFAGVGSRVNYIEADGSLQVRAIYPELHDALSLVTTAATRNSTGNTITGLPSTQFMRVGMAVEATDFPNATIVSIDSPTAITVDQVASSTGSDTEVRIYPHGNGDGFTTFNVPDLSRRFPLGFDYANPTSSDTIGVTGGVENVTLSTAQIPAHDHNVGVTADQAAHDHGGVTGTEPAHVHVAPSSRAFVTVDTPIATAAIANDSPDDLVITLSSADLAQKNNNATAAAGNHNHTIASADPAINTVVSEDSVGGGDSHTNMPPFTVGRWLVHI